MSSSARANLRQEGLARPALRISMLPKNYTSEGLKNMLVFAKDCIQADLISNTIGDRGFRTAIAQFQNQVAAEEARAILDGKLNATGDAKLQVELVQRSPGGSISTRNGQTADTTSSNRHSSRFNGTFQNLERRSPSRSTNLQNGDAAHSDAYNVVFSPQSPIGPPLERQRVSGKSVIGDDVDDETGKLLNDPVAYAQNAQNAQNDMAATGMQTQARRSTLPHLPTANVNGLSMHPGISSPQIPTTAMNGLSINSAVSSPPLSGLTSPRNGPIKSPTVFSPPGLPGAASSNGFPMSPHRYSNTQLPPVNPADQNPPCNTLYVGNLPVDTSEDELKAIFSKQRGYKRLCFRTKSNGPMCFVEFETITYATKTLNDLYGHPLSNSVKGGIRLSFSKNPLGVRREQNGMNSPMYSPGPMSGMNGYNASPPFASASGPPPGLSAPPGLTSPVGHIPNGHSPNGHGPFSPTGSTFGGSTGGSSSNPMSPNGISAPPFRSPPAASGNGNWNGPNGYYTDHLYGR